ncbi:MAG TPA: tRNA preQ1(34) S-adenosylmethionine ribosyltransferase-isomerase QueA [Candidatus Acidoferrum sp.]|nr:tRNA preQ1(34) S-adenosylmethionine ribosyltransferase-isomerase QueA [Candidatus Acidoferrum sp.]
MDISLFDYHLPRELIAQTPNRRRDQSRLMVLDRKTGSREHLRFREVTRYFKPGDALVVNNTKVFKARIWGNRKSGGRVEVFLVRPANPENMRVWEALVSPSRRLDENERVLVGQGEAVQLAKFLSGGKWQVEFESETARRRIISHYGHVPLPHYIAREDRHDDIRRYQTVFADKTKVGAVAAPTAGFHFTRPLLQTLKKSGVRLIELTLHVGPGTFKPVKCDNIENHTVDPEFAEISQNAADAINRTRADGGAIFAVGTTSVRTLESAKTAGGNVQPFSGMVNTYIRPGHRFRLVDHLITNFHLPKSSLLILVSAFARRETVLDAYHEAIATGYRFYSYGDAMLIL